MLKSLKGYKFKADNSMKGFGETDLDKKVIKINKARNKKSKQTGELIDSIFHETLHAKHPNASESTIINKTKIGLKRMSKKSKQKLYNKFK